MNPHRRKTCLLILSVSVVVAASTTIPLSIKSRAKGKQQEQKHVTKLPPVVSHVQMLEVVKATVKDEGTREATALVEIRNNSDLAVMAVEISTRDDINSSGEGSDGLYEPGNPHVIIPPHETKTLEMRLFNMIPDVPLVVSGAVFSDGSEDGDWWSLDGMRAIRKREQAQHRVEKGGPPQ